MLIVGKRYCWLIRIPGDGKYKTGLFTGEYDTNGNAILMTKNGEVWSIPIKNLKNKI